MVLEQKKKICLLSIAAPHYRSLIFQMMNEQFACSFIFGKDDSTVKRLEDSFLKNTRSVENKYIGQTNWYYQPGLLKMTRDYDVLINDLGVFCFSAWLLLLLSKFRRQKVYHWDHGWYGRENFAKKWVKRAYFGLADGAFIYGHHARILMIQNGFNGDKLHVIHNSLDYDKQLEIRHCIQSSSLYSNHFGNNNPVICFIGRLTQVKQLNLLIDAIGLLKTADKHYNVVFIGDGDVQDALAEQAMRLGLEKRIWFYGASYDEETNAELIYNADLCVAPGNIGLTAMHVMMYGCPCISHNDFPWQMPEFEAIKDGETGSFFSRGNAQSLADAINVWFTQKADMRQEVKEVCFREIDENWNPHKQIEIFKQVING